jgi:hypothetical protein
MVKVRECNLEVIDEVFRRAQHDAEERQRLYAEGLRQQEAADGDRAGQLVSVIVDRPDRTSLLIVFNTETGQAAMTSCVRPRTHFGQRPAYHWMGQLRRVRASEAARMLSSGKRRLARWRHPESSVSCPDWIYEPTDENARDWLTAARLFRHEAFVGRITGPVEELFNRVGALLRMLLVIAIISLISLVDPGARDTGSTQNR